MNDKNRPAHASAERGFTRYETFVVAVLVFLQFAVTLDFMILSPLGPVLMPALSISPAQFGSVVSAYAVSAGVAGLLSAGFIDRFDRKRTLLVVFAGFLLGTLFCGLAPNFHALLLARMVAGLFGGVVNATLFAIVADLFPLSRRGRVMGWIQSAFSASQILGLPVGLVLATHLGWHGPFLVLTGLGLVGGLAVAWKLRPVVGHLAEARHAHPLARVAGTLSRGRYLTGFTVSMLVAMGAFVMAPFASNFLVHNMDIPFERLSLVYVATGIAGLVAGPTMGRLADRFGKWRVHLAGTLFAMAIIVWWTRLGASPLWLAMVGNMAMFAAISSRIVTTQALVSAVPDPRDRGAYMSVSSSMQQFAGAVGSWVAGLVVVEETTGRLANYPTLGWIVIGTMALTLVQLRSVDRLVNPRPRAD